MKALKRPNQEGCGLLPSNCLVKVCGRDEYLDRLVQRFVTLCV